MNLCSSLALSLGRGQAGALPGLYRTSSSGPPWRDGSAFSSTWGTSPSRPESRPGSRAQGKGAKEAMFLTGLTAGRGEPKRLETSSSLIKDLNEHFPIGFKQANGQAPARELSV